MSITHKRTIATTADGGTALAIAGQTITGTREIAVSVTVAPAASNALTKMNYVVADVQSIFLYFSDAMTLKTNSSGSPANTFTIPSGGGVLDWNANSGIANPFTSDVTAWYITSTLAGTITGRILTN